MVLIDTQHCEHRKLYEIFLILKNYEKNKYNVSLITMLNC